MAQVAGGTNYDWDWRYQWEEALRLLRELASEWALGKPIAAAEAAAVLVQVLFAPIGYMQIPEPMPLRRRLARTGSVEAELRRERPRGRDVERVSRDVIEILESARASWSESPGEPDGRTVLRSIVGALFERGWSSKPPLKG